MLVANKVLNSNGVSNIPIERFQSRGQHSCKFIGTKESVYIRKEFNSHRTGLIHHMAAVSVFLDNIILFRAASKSTFGDQNNISATFSFFETYPKRTKKERF